MSTCPECKGTGVYNSPFSGEQPCSLGCVKPGPGVLMTASARFGGLQEPEMDADVLAALKSNDPNLWKYSIPGNLPAAADIKVGETKGRRYTAMRDPQFQHVPASQPLEDATLCVIEESTEKPSPAYAKMKEFVQQKEVDIRNHGTGVSAPVGVNVQNLPKHWIQVASDANFVPKFPDQYDPSLWKTEEQQVFGEHMLPPVQPQFRHLNGDVIVRGGNKSGKTAAGDEYGPLYQREDRIHRVGGKVPGDVCYVPIDEARLDGEIKKILASKAGIVDRLVGHPSRQQNRAAFIETGKLAKQDWPLDKQEAVHALIHEKHSCIGHVFAVCRRDEEVNIPPGRLREPIADILWPDLATPRETFLRTGEAPDCWVTQDMDLIRKTAESLMVSEVRNGINRIVTTANGTITYDGNKQALIVTGPEDRKVMAAALWPPSDEVPRLSPHAHYIRKQRPDSQHWTMQYAVNPDVRVQLNMPERDLEVERMFDDFKFRLEAHYRSKKA